MQDALQEVEGVLGEYAVGDMDKTSDEDLIQAYSNATTLDIEPVSVDVKFAMQGLGLKIKMEEEMPETTESLLLLAYSVLYVGVL